MAGRGKDGKFMAGGKMGGPPMAAMNNMATRMPKMAMGGGGGSFKPNAKPVTDVSGVNSLQAYPSWSGGGNKVTSSHPHIPMAPGGGKCC